MATSAPSAASRSAMALPIPLAAPVTTATFLSMLLMGTYLLVGASSGWEVEAGVSTWRCLGCSPDAASAGA